VRLLGLPRRHARGGADRASGEGGRDGASLMLGCFERGLYPKVSRAANWLAPELDVPPRQGCCGALHAHNGELERGRELARELGEALPGTIVTTSGGCSAHLASVVGRERVRELSEWLVERDRAAGGGGQSDGGPCGGGSAGGDSRARGATRPRIGLQDSCHLRNGLGVWKEPRELIARVGEYVELPSAGACCGAAGTYAVLRPEDSARVLDRHLDEIAAADLDAIVVVNPGCYRQLEQGVKRRNLRTRVLHLAELCAEAEAR
jgi:glycolate oxidase iron-sulfur subunit